jgi:maltose alpha-D-glucosyltransferase/alpha-amylase
MRNKIPGFAEPLKESAREWIKQVPRILSFYAKLPGRKIQTKKIRVHGDYHLGQVLNTGKDFVILDFEGEPRRTLGERLLKRSPLVDVAGMIRSFDYALQAALAQQRPEDEARLEMWGQLWRERVTELFLEGYREGVEGATFLPESPEDLNFLIKIFLLDKAVYEIGYELSYRQKFLFIPLKAASRILQNAD